MRSALKLADPGAKTVNLNPQRLPIQATNMDLHPHDIDLPLHRLHCGYKVRNGRGRRPRRGSTRHQRCRGQIGRVGTTQPIKVSCGEAPSGGNTYPLPPEPLACTPEDPPCVVVWPPAANSRGATTAGVAVEDLQETISKLQKQTLSETQQRRMELTVQEVNPNAPSTDPSWPSCTCTC